MNENQELNEVFEEPNELEVSNERRSRKGLGLFLGLAAAAVGGAVVLYKNRDKVTEKKIRKLEAQGYVVTRPEEFVDEYEECDD